MLWGHEERSNEMFSNRDLSSSCLGGGRRDTKKYVGRGHCLFSAIPPPPTSMYVGSHSLMELL